MMAQLFPIALALIVFVAFMGFAFMRTRRYLTYFQQDEYDGARFLKWIVAHTAFDKKLSVLLLILTPLYYLPEPYCAAATKLSVALALGLAAFIDWRAMARAKKALNMTKRARSIFLLALAFSVPIGLVLAVVARFPLLWIIAVQAVPFTLIVATLILQPLEKRVQAKYRAEAVARLAEINPRIIGVTGSFGKTSVKHILGHVLQLGSESAFTPGSVNTVMGIVRVIREQLSPSTRNFVVEMGAYGRGSIQRLCDLTPPDFGIITSIGAAHYERFKDLDTVARAKFELAENTLARGGKMVIDETVLDQPYAKEFVAARRESFIVVGESADADLRILDIKQTAQGIEVKLQFESGPEIFAAPLFGLTHGRNIALSVAMARLLEMDIETIRIALKSTPQIAHRLEINRQANGVTLIDDAYNSNPQGFRAALETLKTLGGQAGRKILVTPGMVELGALHDETHAELGALAANIADVIVIVQPDRIARFGAAIRQTNPAVEIIEVTEFAKARLWIETNLKSGDTVLLENDLPDVYESIPRL